MPVIHFKTEALSFDAELVDCATTSKLLQILPCESTVNTWGDEIYFAVPVSSALEDDAEQVVPPGTVGFWTEGQCLAIPFGPTPISEAGECRLAARVNLLGKLKGDPKRLKVIQPGDTIAISLVE